MMSGEVAAGGVVQSSYSSGGCLGRFSMGSEVLNVERPVCYRVALGVKGYCALWSLAVRMRPVMGKLRYHARTEMATSAFRRRGTGCEVVGSSAVVQAQFLGTVNLVVVTTSWVGCW